MSPGRGRSILVVLLIVLCAAWRLWRTPYDASNATFAPDSTEYMVGAERFAHLGTYDIEIEGKRYPPRYPPFFSVVVLSPIYRIWRHEIGAGIVAVFALSVAGVVAGYRVGSIIAGTFGGVMAALALLMNDGLVVYARIVMTDTPVALAMVALLGIFVTQWRHPGIGKCIAGGLIAALAVGLRPMSILVLPAMCVAAMRAAGRRDRAIGLLCACLPSLCIVVATAMYNRATFGSIARTGYHFWCPLPYDYEPFVFAWRYVPQKLALLRDTRVHAPLIVLFIGALALVRSRSELIRPIALFLVIAIAPITTVYLTYFTGEIRFQFALLAIASVVGAAGASTIVPATLRRADVAIVALAACVLLIPRSGDFADVMRTAADHLSAELPDDAYFISYVDAAFLEPLVLRGTHRHYIPVARWQEYASKAVAYRPLTSVVSRLSWPGGNHRDPLLLAAGAQDVIRWTAREDYQRFHDLVQSGKTVCVDGVMLPKDDFWRISASRFYEMRPIRPGATTLVLSLKSDSPQPESAHQPR
jgi:4-amino-4-deoxy-L-arabinose transferase-like glycosyltransferase